MRHPRYLDLWPSEVRIISRYPDLMSQMTAFIKIRFAAIALFGVALSSCSSSRLKEFEKVHGGMSKSEVLTAVGGPQRTQRWHGRDRWEYRIYGTPDGDVLREVHFEDGKSTYVGAAIKPPISADQQDKLNEAYNHEADAKDAETAATGRDGVTIQRFRTVDENGNVGPAVLETPAVAKPTTGK